MRGRCGRIERVAGRHGQQVGPGPGHHLDEGVPAAAGGHPATVADLVRQVAERDVRRALAVDRQPQVGEWVQPVRVSAALGEQHVGRERADHRRDDGVEGAQPASVAGAGRQRHVDRAALGARAAGLGGEAGAREQRERGLVQADREHPRIVVEDLLDAVAVVHVDVHVRDPLGPQVEEPGDGDGRVVVDAEPGGARGHRVVQAAGDVHRPDALAVPHRLGGRDGGPADPGAGLMHAVEHRVVRGVEAPAGEERVVRGEPDRVEVVRPVHPGQRGLVGRLRRDHADRWAVQHAELTGQRHGELDTHRVERVVAHVVAEQGPVPDHRRRAVRHAAIVAR
jgi:hypothetical protein